jgi:hypothetical protein
MKSTEPPFILRLLKTGFKQLSAQQIGRSMIFKNFTQSDWLSCDEGDEKNVPLALSKKMIQGHMTH